MQQKEKEKEKQSAKVVGAVKVESAVADINEYLEEGDPDENDDKDNFSFEVHGSVCNVKIEKMICQ